MCGRPYAGIWAVWLLTMAGAVAMAQQGGFSQKPIDPTKPMGDPSREADPIAGKMAEQQARSRNADRQKKIISDTDKLLSLATELKQEVDKSDKNTLSLDVVKKADEIEKLAHSVREKMKGGV